jgi:hypothetical protein
VWQSYKELLGKFSGSASLHLDFANFCDTVLNDSDEAAKFLHGAEILESGRDHVSSIRYFYFTCSKADAGIPI